MNAQEIIRFIQEAEKTDTGQGVLSGEGGHRLPKPATYSALWVFGDWKEIAPVLEAHREVITDLVVENDRRNSAVPLLDMKNINARIEPGAIIRDQVEIGDRAVIMMGAIINIGAVIKEGTMIDMGAVLGGRGIVGKNCHIGAGAVLAGVIEPASAGSGRRRRQCAHRRQRGRHRGRTRRRRSRGRSRCGRDRRCPAAYGRCRYARQGHQKERRAGCTEDGTGGSGYVRSDVFGYTERSLYRESGPKHRDPPGTKGPLF